jgi:DNA mismatch repair protein MutS2
MAGERVDELGPSSDFVKIDQALDQLSELSDLLKFDDAFPIEQIRDIRSSLHKLHTLGIFLNPEPLNQILSSLQTSRKIRSYIMSRKEKYPLLLRLTADLQNYPDIEKAISHAIDDNGEVKSHASPKLRQIRRDIETKSSQIRKKLETLSKQFTADGYAQDAIVTMRGGRMVIPVKEEYKNIVKGFIHDESSSGQTVFIEPAEALELNNELRKLALDETREIERILLEIADAIRPHLPFIERDINILGEIEFLYVKARFANFLNGIKPHLNDSGHIHIKKGYHPLLLLKELYKLPVERRPVIPLDLELGSAAQSGRTLIISGPNAGGKTVALKTVGLFALMLQSGLLVPCEHGSHFSIFEQIFADIGDDQSIENDLSTFSSHVSHLSEMVDKVDSNTLILIDEIGSGTDPREGSSLAIAVLEHFNRKKAVSIVTTHHGELKAFAHNSEGIENGSMEFDQETLQPTYVFKPKIPGSSYAFEISKRIGLNNDIIEKAKKISGHETQNLEKLIQELHIQSRRYESMIANAHRDSAEAQGLQALYQQRLQELKLKERHIKKQSLEETQKVIFETRQNLESLIHEIRNSHGDKETIKKAKELIREQNEIVSEELSRIQQTESSPLESPEQLKKGVKVYIPSMDVEGTVMEDPDDSGQVSIGIGAISMRLHIGQLSKAKTSRGKSFEPAPRQHIEWNTDDVRNEIDLRGLNADEAVYKVDAYLTDVQVLGFKEVTIVHGKGDGILRKKIGEFLKRDPRVRNYRLGQWGEGDTGVTVVEIKSE